MKRKKLIPLLATVITLSAVGVEVSQASQASQVQAADCKKATTTTKKKKYGLDKAFVFPKSYQGKWYSSSNTTIYPLNFHRSGFDAPWNNQYINVVKLGKMKGTKKYIWQMSRSWVEHNITDIDQYLRGSKEKKRGNNWIVVSPVDQKLRTRGYAYTVKNEVLDGKKQAVLFESAPGTGKVVNQFFRTEALAQKYGREKFDNMKYSSIF
ncbi:hypothetical protein [Lactobacillus xylocopicola]|uniref:Uncharacterized protein n=1 Tax=Lactobacillus xylocopicola TaxID=2976676 RepID=A0ABM8BG84_9LACO|nr:hypothetical protein [Lactobacillus xylocopicola]BDR60271.1 hypothetical protein KIM322_05320 [Lactobacillus xylocopicola]